MSAPEKGITHMQWVILGLITRQAGRGACSCFNKCTLEFYLCKEVGEVVREVQGEGHPDPKVLEGLCGVQVWYSLCHPTTRAPIGERVA